jgi:hypothetical protein
MKGHVCLEIWIFEIVMEVSAFTAKLQAEVRHLQHGLEQRRLHRLESTESILQDARARLETMHQSVIVPLFFKWFACYTELLHLISALEILRWWNKPNSRKCWSL